MYHNENFQPYYYWVLKQHIILFKCLRVFVIDEIYVQKRTLVSRVQVILSVANALHDAPAVN